MNDADYKEWVNDVKSNEPELTEDEFNTLLESEHVGRKSYSSTHLGFSPPPEGDNAGHNHGSTTDENSEDMDHSDMDHSNMDHTNSESSDSDNK